MVNVLALLFQRSCFTQAGALIFSLSTIYIRTLSTGDVHPLTGTTDSIQSPSITGGVNLHINGDHLLILGNTPGVNGLVWNWKTGELVTKIASRRSDLPFDRKELTLNIPESPPFCLIDVLAIDYKLLYLSRQTTYHILTLRHRS
jgi:hypothetical protein